MNSPPGPVYLSRVLLRALPLSIASYGIFRLLAVYAGITTPTWLAVSLSLFALPVTSIAKGYWRNYCDRRDAEAQGAVLIPQLQDKWPGGLSIIAAIANGLKTGYPGDVHLGWRKQYGNVYVFKVLSESRIMTVEPEHVKTILATQFETFDKGPGMFVQLHSLLGIGVFNSDGNMWKFHRTMTRPFFTKERVTDFDIFDRHAHDAIEQATARLAAGYPIDFQDMVGRFALDSATEFLFGCDVHSLSAGLPYPVSSPLAKSHLSMDHPSNRFSNAFLAAQTISFQRAPFGQDWPLIEFWKDRVKPHRKIIDEFIDPILAEALAEEAATENGSKGENANSSSGTLLSHLIAHTQDRQILKDELVNLLVAGRDTTSGTLTFAMYMLTQRPDITRRLREEMFSIVGNGRPTFDHLKAMKYMRAFINEILRLYPVVAFNSRYSNRATLWPSKVPGSAPFYVPANTQCIYSILLMHRRTDLWGPDALEFDPDRFLDERLHKYLTPNPFIFLPFNAGPRICLGQQFAYHEMSLFLVRLLQQFSGFTFAEDAQPEDSRPPAEWSTCSGPKGRDKIRLGLHLTMYVKGGLWIRMEKAI